MSNKETGKGRFFIKIINFKKRKIGIFKVPQRKEMVNIFITK